MRLISILVVLLLGSASWADTWSTSAGPIKVDAVVTGLDEPWGVSFLPNGGLLITERGGRLLHHAPNGKVSEIRHRLKVHVNGQGGLLDVAVARDFAKTGEIFLTYAHRERRRSGTALAIARLDLNRMMLADVRVIFRMDELDSGGRHYGSRVVEARDGTLFVTIGDRGDRPSAQDLGNENGSVIRVNRDGSIPSDNPFVNDPQPEIWSYGHRNPQGAALDLRGNLWVVEHGAAGGDEVNRVKRGANYGWPVISYGTHYSGAKIGVGTTNEGMEQPAHYWDPSIAPSGMMIYSGKLWPEWRGDIFVGSLKFDYISRLDDGQPLVEVEQLKSDKTFRVRDVREAPDGSIWFLSVDNGALYRMVPGGS